MKTNQKENSISTKVGDEKKATSFKESSNIPIFESYAIKIIGNRSLKESSELVKDIEEFIKYRTRKKGGEYMHYSQLRKVYQIVKNKAYKQDLSNFHMKVIPKLAYVQARHKGNGAAMAYVIREMAAAVEVGKLDTYTNFIEIMEAIVAYHKLHAKL
ncbi:type III-A CRISPR-associated protein Csm2 [Arcticibacterium luteifluviistationis]|uniref:CRISPR system Cms protein Csm2 n=1 Tax=Arcticibacterium luteifluviistationis TaxID=1784714 RepID=A0A2Z4G911_9BACT|nr:type III-A CRISPR-associated protein Csm2 [Arcticibacterium luteifluviistationis]AWV97681.1 hypothetical protein DJ013_05680 [Arcticibacterium luteifluviistationis]